jgi:hypothetical protein
MTPIRRAYLVAAGSAANLLGEPRVAASWSGASALRGFTVGGLAGHLAGQVLVVRRALAAPAPAGERVSLLGHYEKVRWLGADLEDEVNVAIRQGGESAAAEGPEVVAAQVREGVRELEEILPGESAERLVSPPAGPWALRLDDFLVTRLMEIAVHSDDLACSVDMAAPELPDEVLDPVFSLLSRLAVRRHGASALLRALSRSERAPASIAAF